MPPSSEQQRAVKTELLYIQHAHSCRFGTVLRPQGSGYTSLIICSDLMRKEKRSHEGAGGNDLSEFLFDQRRCLSIKFHSRKVLGPAVICSQNFYFSFSVKAGPPFSSDKTRAASESLCQEFGQKQTGLSPTNPSFYSISCIIPENEVEAASLKVWVVAFSHPVCDTSALGNESGSKQCF